MQIPRERFGNYWAPRRVSGRSLWDFADRVYYIYITRFGGGGRVKTTPGNLCGQVTELLFFTFDTASDGIPWWERKSVSVKKKKNLRVRVVARLYRIIKVPTPVQSTTLVIGLLRARCRERAPRAPEGEGVRHRQKKLKTRAATTALVGLSDPSSRENVKLTCCLVLRAQWTSFACA